MSLSRFIALWTHPEYAPDAVSEEELERAEERLQTRLPADYRDAVLQFGLPRPTVELLDAIVDRQLDLRDVSDFLGPAEMIKVTEDWHDLGLSEELVAFATDCVGNLFCFPTEAEAGGEAPVFFFDHDSRAVDVIAPSFTRWIEEFCSGTALIDSPGIGECSWEAHDDRIKGVDRRRRCGGGIGNRRVCFVRAACIRVQHRARSSLVVSRPVFRAFPSYRGLRHWGWQRCAAPNPVRRNGSGHGGLCGWSRTQPTYGVRDGDRLRC